MPALITSSCSGLEQQFFYATFCKFGRTRTASGKPDAVPAAEHNVIRAGYSSFKMFYKSRKDPQFIVNFGRQDKVKPGSKITRPALSLEHSRAWHGGSRQSICIAKNLQH